MALSPKDVEAWFNENVLVVKDQYTAKDEIWKSFCFKFPDMSSAEKGSFFSLFGRLIQKIDNVFAVKKSSKNVGYQGVALKTNVAQFNKHTVMDWTHSTLAPGTSNDILTKEAVVDCFKEHCGVLSEGDRVRFLSLFGQTVVGKGPFSSVSTKKKSFVGLKVKESRTESAFDDVSKNESPAQGEEDIAKPIVIDIMSDGEIKRHITEEKLLTSDKCTSERAQNVGDTVTRNKTEQNIQEKITETFDGDEIVVVSDDECTGNKELPDLLTQDIQSFGEEVDSHSETSEDHDETFVAASLDDEICPHEIVDSPPRNESHVCDQEFRPQELYQRFHRNLNKLLSSHLPGKPKSFKEYLNVIFERKNCMNEKRLEILRRCSGTNGLHDDKLRALLAASFPLVTVGGIAGRNVPVTFEGDSFPQFSQKGKSNFYCEVCIPFQKWAMENGKPHAKLRFRTQASVNAILRGTASLQFSGLVQVKEHADSECHKQAVDFFKAVDDTTTNEDSKNLKRKSTNQQSIRKFFCPLNAERPLDHLQPPKLERVKCCHLWDPEVVKHFKADCQIRRWTAKTLFKHQVASGELCCFKTIEGHENCCDYQHWCAKHPIDAKENIKKANESHRSIFVPMKCIITPLGKTVQVDGSIKSLHPPCTGEAVSYDENPFSCTNCAKQLRDLKDILRHREKGPLAGMKDRIGIRGFNQRYAKSLEIKSALNIEQNRRKEAERNFSRLTRIKLTTSEWERSLMDSYLSCDDEKLILDLIRLFKMGVSKTRPVQMMVIRNLTAKLSKGNNNHYLQMIKDISSIFRNELGTTNYSLLADMFGLASNTTASNHGKEVRLDAGLNKTVIDKAAGHYKGFPVNEASDGARSLRYLQPRLTNSEEVVLLGKGWNPDVENWTEETIQIPRKDASKGDQDDYDALKRLVNEVINKQQLAKNVSIHNFTALATIDKPSLIYCLWPTVDKGYKANHLLKYWEKLRGLCYYTVSGDVRENPINLLTYSTDSAGFSLSAANKLMSPTKEEVQDGVIFLGLGIEGERYLAPYYWHLPSIACLDYDHEQRLFLKNLKYETRELTFWEENGKITRLATINHLHDLKYRCQKLGLDCGFNATDLLLIFFCDQNSDACERLFTPRTADLLDDHVPGSAGTSMYIRAVCRLIDPFRKIDFGCPADMQESASSGITILRLWKRLLELKKKPLHSKPGAKSDPAKRGKFLTSGCYTTAEILFSAVTLYQLAMFLHFKHLGLSGSSLYNTGTKSTERIISELQGKTNEIRSLDSQPSFADMLDKSTRVQFNINAKQRLAQAGAKVRQSSNRRQRAFAFSKHMSRDEGSYKYPSHYKDFQEEQKHAHLRGVKEGQRLFEKYMPAEAVDILKRNSYWEIQYSYDHPSDIQLMEGALPEHYNMLHKTYANVKDNLNDPENDMESDFEENGDRESERVEEQEIDDEPEDELVEEKDVGQVEEEKGKKGEKWKISKLVDGRMTYIHIKQAIKLILPREYIARCRQKRHWAAKYLPGKAPLDPTHDVIKFSHVALKSPLKGNKVFDIARVEAIQSSKDGSNVTSFKLRGDSTMRVRFSLYQRSSTGDTYIAHPALGLTHWRSPAAILGPVELIPVSEEIPGCYRLHDTSKKRLNDMGYVDRRECQLNTASSGLETAVDEHSENQLPEDFYEIDDVLERRLCEKTFTYEYKVRFKGYSSEEDMWLPASYFNRAMNFQSLSKFGRKRKHKIDPDAAQEFPGKSRKTASTKEKKVCSKKGQVRSRKTATKIKKKCRVRKKGKAFRSTLPSSLDLDVNSSDETQSASLETSEASIAKRYTASTPFSEIKRNTVPVINVDDIPTGEIPQGIGVFSEVLRQHDNFRYPRGMLAETNFPNIDGSLTSYTLSVDKCKLTDSISVKTLPPQSVLDNIVKELEQSPEETAQGNVKILSYGVFDINGIRTLQRFHRLKCLRAEVSFEKQWVNEVFKNTPFEKEVRHALFDRWNPQGTYLVSYGNYRITSQELSLLCGERYLSDEVLNLLALKYCDRANEEHQSCQNILLPSFLSTGLVLESVVTNICLYNDTEKVTNMFLPVYMPDECHWGLAIFSVIEHTVFFDDGYHCPIPEDLKSNASEILRLIHQATGNDNFHPKKWCQIKRFKVPMPNQPDSSSASKTGCGSCGVAVICSIRDICNGITNSFTWTYEDAPRLRAELMLELLDLSNVVST